jgi:hypothetical protein
MYLPMLHPSVPDPRSSTLADDTASGLNRLWVSIEQLRRGGGEGGAQDDLRSGMNLQDMSRT